MNVKLENELVRFISANKDNVYRLAFSYVRNAEDALDIVSDSIHKALSRADRLKLERSLKPWFYKIVVNTALDFLRRQKRIQLVDDQTLETISPASEDIYTDMDLEKAMEALPVAFRIVIVLRFFEDMKIEEVADVLNENVSTIKSRLYHGLRKLRLSLEQDELKEVKNVHG